MNFDPGHYVSVASSVIAPFEADSTKWGRMTWVDKAGGPVIARLNPEQFPTLPGHPSGEGSQHAEATWRLGRVNGKRLPARLIGAKAAAWWRSGCLRRPRRAC